MSIKLNKRTAPVSNRIIGKAVLFAALTVMPIVNAPAAANELSHSTAQRVQSAHAHSLEGELTQAIELLESISTSRDYDKAFVARMLGVFYWQNDQIEAAIAQLRFAVESGNLEEEQTVDTTKMLADLYLSNVQFEEALGFYLRLVDSGHANEMTWLRITQSYYQLAKWPDVLNSVKQYQKLEPTLDVAMLSMRLGAEFQLKKWSSASNTLGLLIELEPDNARWWQQLVSIEIRRERSNSALNVLTLSRLQGIPLSQHEVRLLAQLYATQGIPLKSAQTLALLDDAKTDMNTIVRQAQLWQQAKQWKTAVEYWQLAATRNAKYHWNVAQLFLSQRDYDSALIALEQIPEKQLSSIMMFAKVQSAYRTQQLKLALTYAKRARTFESTAESEHWVAYLSKQVELSKQL
ncbi:tetratricopeptide repeat protein [Vibrio amylolyticus]|uniref:tetratricopeptide repeat protein n=1 Tax=Vibrio amylolyticus TaxID=2847292 RepID=UPI0035508A53